MDSYVPVLVTAMTAMVLQAGGVGGAGGACPARCSCGDAGLELEVACDAFTARALPGRYATLQCEPDADTAAVPCEPMPYLAASPPRVLPSLGLRDCELRAGALQCALRALGASALLNLTLQAPRAPLAADQLRGAALASLVSLRIVSAASTRVVPVAVLHALPALRRLTVSGARLRLESDAFVGAPPLHYLELSMDGIHELPARGFRGLASVTTLTLWGNDIKHIPADAFEGLDSLEVLDLSSNGLRTMAVDSLKWTRRLRELHMFANSLESVPTALLAGLAALELVKVRDNTVALRLEVRALAALPALRELTLERCGVRALAPQLLRGSTALRRLHLAHNHIDALPPDVFVDQTDLQYLDLTDNRIQNISADVFSHLKELVELKLDMNRITSLPPLLFSGSSKLESLSIDDNGLQIISEHAFTGLPALSGLSLARNELTLGGAGAGAQYWELGVQSPLNALLSLQRLDLSGNNLTIIFDDWRFVLLNLKTLNLSQNLFTNLTDADINFLSHDVIVDLRNNNITTVDLSDEFATSPEQKLGRILLDGNPLHCDCRLYALVRRLNGSAPAEELPLDVGEAQCVAPPALAGVPVRRVPLTALACALPPPACPARCRCELRPPRELLLDCEELPPLDRLPAPRDHNLRATTLHLRRPSALLLATLPDHVTELRLAGLNLTTAPSPPAPPSLAVLDLTDNRLARAPLGLLKHSPSLKLLLAGNPLACDCHSADELAALQRLEAHVLDYRAVRCAGGEPAWRVDTARLCGGVALGVGGAALALLGLLVAALTVLRYRYWHEVKVFVYARGWCSSWLREEELDRGKRFDAFVSFSHLDESFVVDELVPGLERAPHAFKLCVHYRDWIAGEWIPAQIARSVEESRRTIVVLSRNFVESVWGRLEFRAAHVGAMREGRARVVVVLLDDVATDARLDPELRAYLATNTYVKRGDPWFWEKLRYALPRRRDERQARFAGDKLARSALDARLTSDNKIVCDALSPPQISK